MAQDLKMTSTLHWVTSYLTKLKFKKGKFKNEPANTAITIFLSEYQVIFLYFHQLFPKLRPQNSFVKTSLIFLRALGTHSENSTPDVISLPTYKKYQRAS